MTGHDLKKTRDALGLNDDGFSRLVGASAVVLGVEERRGGGIVGHPGRTKLSALSYDLLTRLWSQVSFLDFEPVACKALGVHLAKGMTDHGAGYAAWLILNDECLRTRALEIESVQEFEGRTS